MMSSATASTDADVLIRAATPSDSLALAKLRYEFRASTGVATESEADFVRRCAAWMETRLQQNDAWHCWVAAKQEHLLGCLWIQLVEKIPNPRAEPEYHAYVTNFYLQETARGRGTGAKMLTSALDWCRACEVHAVILWPTERSRSLYERHGFAMRDHMLQLLIR